LGEARNIVIYNALGEYVIWVDADEILTNDFVQKQIRLMDLNQRAGIATGRISILENENLLVALDLIPYVVQYSRQEWKSDSKFPSTGGATYRVVAAKQVGGFDEEITRVGEDMEIAYRIKGAGWLIVKGDGVFYERHGAPSTLTDLLRREFNYGIHCRRLYRKTGRFISLSTMNPFASMIAGVLYALHGYRLTRRAVVLFLLPPHFSIKMLAWFYGFSRG
jgi:glycosyltransferase involved in cell wall biosynthesis